MRDRWCERRQGLQSPEAIVPLVLGLLSPKRIVDLGCGDGAWLAAFAKHGVQDFLGIDVQKKALRIPEDKFLARDLRKPLQLQTKFDLAICLEVAEHLPPGCAEFLVESLVRLAPVILFSAAIPYQQGFGHLNLQWPDYWEKHFQAKGFVAVDALRRKIWQNHDLSWWYRQNMFLLVDRTQLEHYPPLRGESTGVISLVHPENYLAVAASAARTDPQHISLRRHLSLLPFVAFNSVRRRMAR